MSSYVWRELNKKKQVQSHNGPSQIKHLTHLPHSELNMNFPSKSKYEQMPKNNKKGSFAPSLTS